MGAIRDTGSFDSRSAALAQDNNFVERK